MATEFRLSEHGTKKELQTEYRGVDSDRKAGKKDVQGMLKDLSETEMLIKQGIRSSSQEKNIKDLGKKIGKLEKDSSKKMQKSGKVVQKSVGKTAAKAFFKANRQADKKFAKAAVVLQKTFAKAIKTVDKKLKKFTKKQAKKASKEEKKVEKKTKRAVQSLDKVHQEAGGMQATFAGMVGQTNGIIKDTSE